MKICKLDLRAYGPFTERVLDLSRGQQGLHIIYGDNEAGKSSALRALKAWLFGIEHRTSDNFVHDYQKLRVGGKLRLADGTELAFIRRKAKKNTLLDPETEQTLPDDVLPPFLGGLDARDFSRIYGINHGQLLVGGKEILEQSGDLGQAMFSAAAGLDNIRKISTTLRESADALFTPRSTKSTINAALSRFNEARKQVKNHSVKPSDYRERQKALAENKAHVAGVDAKLGDARRKQRALERIERTLKPLALRQDRQQRLADLGTVILLPEDFPIRRAKAVETIAAAAAKISATQNNLDRLDEDLKALNVHELLLSHGDRIDAQHQKLGQIHKGIEDRSRREVERHRLQGEAEKILTVIRGDLSLADAETLRPLLLRKKRIEELAEQSKLAAQAQQSLAQELVDIDHNRQTLQAELNGIRGTDSGALTALRVALNAAQKGGDFKSLLRKMRDDLHGRDERCAKDLKRLGRFAGTHHALAGLALPLVETIDRFERVFLEFEQDRRDRKRRRDALEEEVAEIEDELQRLNADGEVPSPADLQARRGARDGLWEPIRLQLEANTPFGVDGPEHSRRFETSIAEADEVADHLFNEAEKVARRSQLEARRSRKVNDLSRLVAEDTRQAEVFTAHQHQWETQWLPLKIEAGTPTEMRAWLARAQETLDNYEAKQNAEEDAETLGRQALDHAEAVAAHLQSLGQDAPAPSAENLDLLMENASQFLQQADQANAKGEATAEQLLKAGQLRKMKERQQASAQRRAEQWREEWANAINGLGLDAHSHPTYVASVMESLQAFFASYDECEKYAQRIEKIDADYDRFAADTAALIQELQWKTTEADPLIVVEQLHAKLAESRVAQAKEEKIRERVAELRLEVEESKRNKAEAEATLLHLHEMAEAEKVEDLPLLEERSRKRRQLEGEIEQFGQNIISVGDGLALKELEQEASGLHPDEVARGLDSVKRETVEFNQIRDDLRTKSTELEIALKAYDGSAAAASAAERAESELAYIAASAERYLKLRIASVILAEQVERYRQEHQAPLLKEAGRIFARLTLGSFCGLRDDLDDQNRPVIWGLRDDKSEVPVTGMSDGTCDQLYLALRLATLQQHFVNTEPMPFIVDDILLSFDDDRSRACLEVLAELAQKTQVIFFSHHRRHVELAQRIEADAGIFVQELSG